MKYQYVAKLSDLMTPEDYREVSEKKKIRVQISVTNQGIEILGDSAYIFALEELFEILGFDEMERTLCG